MKISKELRDEIRKQTVSKALGLLGTLLSALSPTVKLWASQLSLSETQVSAMRYWLLCAGGIALISSVWILFVRTFRKLRSVEKQFQDSQGSPFRVSDEFRFVPESGFWIEKKTKLRVCASCLLPPTKIVSPLLEGLGLDLDGNPCLVWRCGHCRSEYWHESQKVAP
jgi:hypothetical protein